MTMPPSPSTPSPERGAIRTLVDDLRELPWSVEISNEFSAAESELAALEARDADFAEAAGELLVEIPEPGTVLSKLLSANVLMRRENADLRAQLARRDEDDEGKFLAFREGLGVEIYLCGGAGTADGWRELGQFAAKLLAKHERQRIERAARVSADASKET